MNFVNDFFFFSADTLFELWNKFEPRLPMIYYQRKLLEMGDFLASIKVSDFFWYMP